jgi:hypothetical protein
LDILLVSHALLFTLVRDATKATAVVVEWA